MRKILLPGIAAGIVMLALGMAVNYLFMMSPTISADFNNAALIRPWSDPLMSLFFVFPFLQGIIFAGVWEKSKTLFKGTSLVRGTYFGFAMWLIATVPGMFMSYTSFPLSLATIISWTVSGFITCVAAGMVFAKMNR